MAVVCKFWPDDGRSGRAKLVGVGRVEGKCHRGCAFWLCGTKGGRCVEALEGRDSETVRRFEHVAFDAGDKEAETGS